MDEISIAIESQKLAVRQAQQQISLGNAAAALDLIRHAKSPKVALEGLAFLEGLCLITTKKLEEGIECLLFELSSFPENDHARHMLGETLRIAQGSPNQRAERTRMASLLNSDGYILDIGSNVGNFSHTFLEMGFNVLALEPHPKTARWQRERFKEKSQQGQFTLLEMGLSSAQKSLNLIASGDLCNAFSSFELEWCSSFPATFEGRKTHTVETTTLGTILQKHASKRCALAKIDTPGHEGAVIEGLQNIERSLLPPLLVVEITPSTRARSNLQQISTHLSDLGYDNFKFMLSWGNLLMLETGWVPFREIERQDLSSAFEVYATKPEDLPILSVFVQDKAPQN